VGVEALARWRHPTRGLLPPGEFIPIVERTSMIHAFTANVLTAALAQTRTWQDRGLRLPVSVNVSTRCLLDMNLVELVESRLRRAGVAGELLCLEITEDTVMADPDRAIDTLRRIRALGVRVSLDDYGTGYSSLAYLRVLPVDELKVDRSFMESLGSGERHEAVLVRSVVALGHDLGLTVVAEGVEDERCLSELRRLGCDVAQGYHLARPMTPASLEVWMSRGCPAPLTSRSPGRGGPAAVPL
jgi:EAL domain-containing protein (putative c-di-GMP-specific phosphodiesterase class I)